MKVYKSSLLTITRPKVPNIPEKVNMVFTIQFLYVNSRNIKVQMSGQVGLTLSWGACVLLQYLQVLGAAGKSVLTQVRMAEKKKKKRKSRKKQKKIMDLDWKLGTQGSGDQKSLTDGKM